jgi:hypothetical protein
MPARSAARGSASTDLPPRSRRPLLTRGDGLAHVRSAQTRRKALAADTGHAAG